MFCLSNCDQAASKHSWLKSEPQTQNFIFALTSLDNHYENHYVCTKCVLSHTCTLALKNTHLAQMVESTHCVEMQVRILQ